ncbi:hypothetical protein MSG28_015513 [Choristoneura fumiferana]|uniref:Uncharacterized protein n=1 Tax=Choristoneura fumiferana TaxID=7141 RepID=A0ACC0KB14_CHOFU|nr:hypothetical protein MSG28_015513 [Choristoneura fumiferana]
MDINRLPNEKKLQLCRWYFKVGCIFLPFVWAVNAVWFFKEAFMKPPCGDERRGSPSVGGGADLLGAHVPVATGRVGGHGGSPILRIAARQGLKLK